MKLKILINKMDTFINDIISDATRKNIRTRNFSYFDLYENSFSKLKKREREKIVTLIEHNMNSIDKSVTIYIIYFLRYDISSLKKTPNNTRITNYIIFCLFCHITESKQEKIYFNEDRLVNLESKDRPHRFCGSVYSYGKKNIFICNVTGVMIDSSPTIGKICQNFLHLRDEGGVLPYCEEYGGLFVIEKLIPIDPYTDPLYEVLKDLVNQLLDIYRNFWFSHIASSGIGQSRTVFKRYFLSCFETLIDKETDNNITKKSQLVKVLHVLSEIYVTGIGDFEVKSKFPPFCDLLNIVEDLNENTCHKDFIYHLLDNKI